MVEISRHYAATNRGYLKSGAPHCLVAGITVTVRSFSMWNEWFNSFIPVCPSVSNRYTSCQELCINDNLLRFCATQSVHLKRSKLRVSRCGVMLPLTWHVITIQHNSYVPRSLPPTSNNPKTSSYFVKLVSPDPIPPPTNHLHIQLPST